MKSPQIPFQEMIDNAVAAVKSYSVEEVSTMVADSRVLLVDIRDIRELDREGRIPGAKHVPRGMLEFWMFPDSPYYRDYLGEAEEIVLYCNRGWRSALAAIQLQQLGITVSHMNAGFSGWKESGLAIEAHKKKPAL